MRMTSSTEEQQGSGIPSTMSASKGFPVMYSRSSLPGPMTIPWSLAEKAYSAYTAKYGSRSSLEDFARRGGFGADELDYFVPGWRDEVSEITSLRSQLTEARVKIDQLEHSRELEKQWQKPACRHCGLTSLDLYMVTDEVWNLVCGGSGHLHLACLEVLIGRPITDSDFTSARCNEPLKLMFRNGIQRGEGVKGG